MLCQPIAIAVPTGYPATMDPKPAHTPDTLWSWLVCTQSNRNNIPLGSC